MMSGNSKYDVVVIGGGLSGLTAAKLLKENNLNVIVLEAADHVGGRMLTVQDEKVGYIDYGAAFVKESQHHIKGLCAELGLKLFPIPENMKTVICTEKSWMALKQKMARVYNPYTLLDLNNVLYTTEKLARSVDIKIPSSHPKAEEWDKTTVKIYLDRICRTRYVRRIIENYVRKTMCCEPHQLSFLFFLTFIHSGGGIQRLPTVQHTEIQLLDQKVIGGTMQICDLIADKIGHSNIHISSPVSNIDQTGSCVKVTTCNNESYECDKVILAINPILSRAIKFNPPLPDGRVLKDFQTGPAPVVMTFMYYETPFWRENGLETVNTSSEGPVYFVMDDTKADDSNPGIKGFVNVNEGRVFLSLAKDDRKFLIKSQYAKVFDDTRFLKPIHYVEKVWSEDSYNTGCGLAGLPPGAMTTYGRFLRAPWRNIYFAGTEMASAWAGHMDGAIEAGERAAREVMHNKGLIPRSSVYIQETGSQISKLTPKGLSRTAKFLPGPDTFALGLGIPILASLGYSAMTRDSNPIMHKLFLSTLTGGILLTLTVMMGKV